MTLTSSMEDYLEAVLIIQKERGYVRCVDVAEQLGVTKPSVILWRKIDGDKDIVNSILYL